MQNFGKIAVLMGGFSSKHNISLDNSAAIIAALKGRGASAYAFGPKETPLADLKTQGSQTAFNILHGTHDEDGVAQETLEPFGIPYTGSGVAASVIGMDEYRCKLIWQALGLPVPEFTALREDIDLEAVEKRLRLPVFVKPANEGSGVEIVKVKERGHLKGVYTKLKHMKGEIIAGRFIGGGRYSCPVFGGRGLPSILIVPTTEFYDYETKHNHDDTVYRRPSDLSAADEELICELAIRGAEAVGVERYVRVDFLKDLDGKLYLLKINTPPGMTSHSLVPKSTMQIGMDFLDLCIEILKTAHVG